MSLYDVIRSLLFRFDAEDVHDWTLRALAAATNSGTGCSLLRRAFDYEDERLAVQAFGLNFRNRVGLAGGYDKDGTAVVGLGCLGFGHVEVGTVTWRAQPGNPRPRVFRLPEDRGLINSMGFPSQGSEAVARRLSVLPKPRDVLVGVNIGKNKDTPLDAAADEYRAGVRRFYAHADYLSINISSPNTLGLRELQSREYLGHLLAAVTAERGLQHAATARRVPLLVKLSPDMTWQEADQALETLLGGGADGVIATNTTTDRQGLRSPLRTMGGGLSGAPLTTRSTDFVAHVRRTVGTRLPIIAAGGIFSTDDALAKLNAGATLVQVYTGLVYRGPAMVREILRGLLSARPRG